MTPPSTPSGTRRQKHVEAAGVDLYVRGFIDRVDIEGSGSSFGTSRRVRSFIPAVAAQAEPVALLDLQIGLYALVARRLAAARKLGLAAAYVYTGLQADRERAFRDDIGVLETAATSWLKTATAVLRERAFVRTPSAEDCGFCAFTAVCGDDFHSQVASMLEPQRRGALRALRVLKRPEDT